jgi:hypothetical protein
MKLIAVIVILSVGLKVNAAPVAIVKEAKPANADALQPYPELALKPEVIRAVDPAAEAPPALKVAFADAGQSALELVPAAAEKPAPEFVLAPEVQPAPQFLPAAVELPAPARVLAEQPAPAPAHAAAIRQCQLSMTAYDTRDTSGISHSYITLANIQYVDTVSPSQALGAFYMAIFIPVWCQASNFEKFYVSQSTGESDKLIEFIEKLPANAHLIAVTTGQATRYLSLPARETLESVGFSFASSTAYDPKAAFHAIIGSPERIVYKTSGVAGRSVSLYENVESW